MKTIMEFDDKHGYTYKMVFKWQSMDEYTSRAPVFGGWIVKTLEDVYHYHEAMGNQYHMDFRISTVFVTDPNHNWKVDVIED